MFLIDVAAPSSTIVTIQSFDGTVIFQIIVSIARIPMAIKY